MGCGSVKCPVNFFFIVFLCGHKPGLGDSPPKGECMCLWLCVSAEVAMKKFSWKTEVFSGSKALEVLMSADC